MSRPNTVNSNISESIFLNISGLRGRGKQAAPGRQVLLRITLTLLFAAGFCLAPVPNADAAPTLLNSDAVNDISSSSNTLPNFTISSGSNRILIVATDEEEDESDKIVQSVMLAPAGSGELLTNPGFETGNATGWTNGGGSVNINDADFSSPRSGSYMAYWNNSSSSNYLYQNVDLSAYAALIDAGSALINATGWFMPRECSQWEDRYRMWVIFYDGSSTELGRYDTGEIINECGWIQRGVSIPVSFANGDQFGARARADGQVEVYKNGSLLGVRDVTAWPQNAQSGYIGLFSYNAGNFILDDFFSCGFMY